MNVKALILALFLPAAAFAQGFAGLGTQSDGFATPEPNPQFTFPDDHGPHPDFRIEWWYVTANLKGRDGTDYGLQWTLFRSALRPGEALGFNSPQIWLGHAAITSPNAHFVSERFGRGGIGQAGVTAQPFEAWIDDWHLTGDLQAAAKMRASGEDFAYDMSLIAKGPLVFQGAQGYSVKSAEGQASYYYSQPFFDISGTLTLPSGPQEVTGHAWLDREWSSQPLGADQTGWDWFSLAFDSGDKMMGFLLRDASEGSYSSATWIEADGTATPFPDGAFAAEPLVQTEIADRKIPTKWRAQLPERGVDVVIEAINPNAWMDTSVPYWEGPVRISGSHQGRGYLEMTGY
jgi:predicted secreted hydrolase